MSSTSAAPTPGIGSSPSRYWYLIAVLVFLAGFAGMAMVLFNQLSKLGDDLVQIVVPGERELTLEAGSYTIFHERQSIVDGRIFSVDSIAGLAVTLTSADGKAILDDNYIEVKYEHLLTKPEEETKRLFGFLRVDKKDTVVRRCVMPTFGSRRADSR
jgi:hypothetical protein